MLNVKLGIRPKAREFFALRSSLFTLHFPRKRQGYPGVDAQ